MKKTVLTLLVLGSMSAFGKTIYFSSQVSAKSANIYVKIGNQECQLRSETLQNVDRTVGLVDDGISEKIATCELDFEPGTYDYEIEITPASGRKKGFVYYWALDNKPIDNRRAMSAWFLLENVNPVLSLKISQSDEKISSRRPLQARGQITID